MLKAALVQIGDAVGVRVVVADTFDEGEVKGVEASPLKDRQIRVVRQELINLIRERVGDRMRGGLAEFSDETAVTAARLEHHRRPAAAARVEVQHDACVFRRRVLVDESPRARQPHLLPVREQQDHVVLQRLARLQRARRLKQRRHARTVVTRAGALRHRVVVRDEQDGLAARRPL